MEKRREKGLNFFDSSMINPQPLYSTNPLLLYSEKPMFEQYWELAKPYIVGTVKGFGAGAFAAGLGYLKTVKADGELENFNGLKFTRTIIVGGVVGALAEVFGVSTEKADECLVYPFVIYAIDICTKIIWRRGLKRLFDYIRSA